MTSSEHELYFAVSINDSSMDAEALVELRFHEHDPSALSLRLHLLGDAVRRMHTYSKLDRLGWNYCTLYPKPPADKIVEVLGISGMSFTGSPVQTVTIDCKSVEVGMGTESAAAPNEYWVVAQLIPSGILIQPGARTFYPTGEVKRERGDDKPIEIHLGNGKVGAQAIFERATGEEFGNAVTKLVERTIVSGSLSRPADVNLATFHEQFRSDLDDICLVLSLCYRWPVTFYKIEYFDAARAPADGAFLRRAVEVRKRTKSVLDELVNVRELVDGGLDRLCKSFRDSASREDLARAISYLSHSYATRGLETSYFTAFAAFETAVTAAEGKNAYALSAGKWDRLHKRLTTAIEAFLVEEQIGDEDRSDLLLALGEKLPEVRWLSLRRRIRTVIKRLDLMVDDLWPLGFDEGIRRAAASRNDLFHAAKLADPNVLHGDLVRIRVLAERIILKLLQWPDAKIWRWYDQELRWTNKSDRTASDERVPAPGSPRQA